MKRYEEWLAAIQTATSAKEPVAAQKTLADLILTEQELAYVRGTEVARKLLRMQLGLGTPEDRMN